jgi:hypothetical protein
MTVAKSTLSAGKKQNAGLYQKAFPQLPRKSHKS